MLDFPGKSVSENTAIRFVALNRGEKSDARGIRNGCESLEACAGLRRSYVPRESGQDTTAKFVTVAVFLSFAREVPLAFETKGGHVEMRVTASKASNAIVDAAARALLPQAPRASRPRGPIGRAAVGRPAAPFPTPP